MHKNSATRLREENDILRSQNESIITPALIEKDRQIEEWKLKNQNLYERIEQLEIENNELHQEVKILKESFVSKFLTIKFFSGRPGFSHGINFNRFLTNQLGQS